MTVTLSVVGVLMGLGAPSLSEWASSARRTDLANAMLANLHRARSEAITRNSRVTLCKSGDGALCATSGAWDQGLIVYEDRNNNGVRDPAEPLLHREGPLPAGWRLFGNASVRDRISYGPEGMTRMESGAFQAGTIMLCQSSAAATEGRQIIVNSSGRPRVQRALLDSCP
ncbi:GspH/FimT family pseudopilin [Ramlibacter sp. MMS24-I3-19]|uniref:GspH/FimT family pseudopilin n=1 Tax=Ramlibacter sp. MMS24-I3-19 TaxID=3416606 RepID=UPI003CFF4801